MAQFKVFTWNMQRAQSISSISAFQKDQSIASRYKVLKALAEWADFGFITEPGKDIRACFTHFHTLKDSPLTGYFCCSQESDNQSDGSACRPVVYSRQYPLTAVHIPITSGADDAYRYPAAATITLPHDDGQSHKTLLLVSLHATSGGNADKNCQLHFDDLYKGEDARRVWIMGGDFNCKGPGVYMPQRATHQRGYVLDGFFADQYRTNFAVRGQPPQPYYEQTLAQNLPAGRLETNLQADPHGFVVDNCHLSDHVPVLAQLEIVKGSEDLDQANILTGKRAKKPSRKYAEDEMEVVDI